MEDTLHGPVRGFQAYYLPHPTPRLAGAPDISPCPQSRKDVLFAKAHEVFRNTSNVGEYYYLIRPYLGEHCTVPPLSLLLLNYHQLYPVCHPLPQTSPLPPWLSPTPSRWCPFGGTSIPGPRQHLHGH